MWSQNALRRIMQIMEEYGEMSGLCINVSKTSLMITGKKWEGENSVQGVNIVTECKLLGVKIDNKVENLHQNWTESLRKVWVWFTIGKNTNFQLRVELWLVKHS